MYFTVQVTRKNGTISKQIFDFPTLREAKANHYYFMSSSSADTDIDYILGEIIDYNGFTVCQDIYKEDGEY